MREYGVNADGDTVIVYSCDHCKVETGRCVYESRFSDDAALVNVSHDHGENCDVCHPLLVVQEQIRRQLSARVNRVQHSKDAGFALVGQGKPHRTELTDTVIVGPYEFSV